MYMAMKEQDLKALAIELEEDSRGIYFFITFYENNGLCSWIANEKW